MNLVLNHAALYVLACTALLVGCSGIPEGLAPITDLNSERYLGQWYEIARLDHSFERGLSRVTANYSKRDDGGIKVINRGFNEESGEWSEAEGRAYFIRSPDIGSLKVSFFGPFFGAYHIIALDRENYQWALVCGYSRDYLWILSRTPVLEPTVLQTLLELAERYGFTTGALIYPEH